MSEASRLASPVRLLYDAHEAREVLVLTFNADLAFFERFALGAARALGALVTVVSDADSVSVDPRAVHGAGRTYLDARVLCRSGGAFHPKLLVIAGEDRAVAAIGSGNATMAGWHGNAEIWTVLCASPDETPDTLLRLGDWLIDLPGQLHLVPAARNALVRVGRLLQSLPNPVPGPRLVTNLESSILGQLPEGPVDECVAYAPFYDPAGSGLRSILQRLRPQRTEVHVQPQLGSFDGAALTAATSEVACQFHAVDEGRYHHGKLVEWSRGKDREALVGSPNITAAALLRSMPSGGNCEVALLAAVGDNTLRPALASEISVDAVRAITRTGDDESTVASPRLLSAAIEAAGIRITLAYPMEVDGVIELGGDPWLPIGTIPAATWEVVIEHHVEPGAPIRVTDPDGLVSKIVFAMDGNRVLRPATATTRRREATEEELFEDPRLFLEFHRDVLALRDFLASSSGAPSAGGDKERGTRAPSSGPAYVSWQERLEVYEEHLGDHLTRYGLALPVLGRSARGAFAREVLEPGTGTPDEPEERDDEETDPSPPPPDLRSRSDGDRRRYRQWCAHLAEISGTLPAPGRVIAVRLILRAAAGHLWDRRDDWLSVAASAIGALATSGDALEDERAALASTAAVGMSVLRGQLWDGWIETEQTQTVDRAAGAVRELLAARDAAQVRRIAEELQGSFGISVDPIVVEETAQQIEKDDPIGDAVRLIEERGDAVGRTDATIVLNDPVSGDPILKASEVVGLCYDAPLAGARAHSDSIEALVVWRSPYLLVIDRNQHRTRGQLFELRGTMRPGDYVRRDKRLPSQHRMTEWFNEDQSPEIANTMLAAVGAVEPFPGS